MLEQVWVSEMVLLDTHWMQLMKNHQAQKEGNWVSEMALLDTRWMQQMKNHLVQMELNLQA